jgi:hypothetical protein
MMRQYPSGLLSCGMQDKVVSQVARSVGLAALTDERHEAGRLKIAVVGTSMFLRSLFSFSANAMMTYLYESVNGLNQRASVIVQVFSK